MIMSNSPVHDNRSCRKRVGLDTGNHSRNSTTRKNSRYGFQRRQPASSNLLLLITAIFCSSIAQGFVATSSTRNQKRWGVLQNPTRCQYKKGSSSSDGNGNFSQQDSEELQERLMSLRLDLMEEEYRRPPNPDLSPQEFVAAILNGLYNNSNPLPDSGFRLLLRASTKQWRDLLYSSVAAPLSAPEEVTASALGQAMSRTNNQFAILTGEAEDFQFHFPTDPLDYADGTCWVECRLRDLDDQLLAVTGWQLEQREEDGAWLVDSIDWQDFRDDFRPGIGREEWMRICG